MSNNEIPPYQYRAREFLRYRPTVETSSAIEAVLEAGKAIRMTQGRGAVEHKLGTHNVVTEGDRASGTSILSVLKTRFPDDDYLTEETSTEATIENQSDWLTKKRLWIIDELDGSSNNKDGIEDVYVSIAYAEEGNTKSGVVYNPYRHELYVAEHDQNEGMYIKLADDDQTVVHSQPLRVSDQTELKGASFETSMSYDDQQSADHNVLRLAMNLNGVSGRPREIGTSVGQFCRVARGQSDFQFHKGLKPWDLAAGKLLIEKAGGIFIGMDGNVTNFMTPHCVAGNEPVVRDFVSLNLKLANDLEFKALLISQFSDIIERYNAT